MKYLLLISTALLMGCGIIDADKDKDAIPGYPESQKLKSIPSHDGEITEEQMEEAKSALSAIEDFFQYPLSTMNEGCEAKPVKSKTGSDVSLNDGIQSIPPGSYENQSQELVEYKSDKCARLGKHQVNTFEKVSIGETNESASLQRSEIQIYKLRNSEDTISKSDFVALDGNVFSETLGGMRKTAKNFYETNLKALSKTQFILEDSKGKKYQITYGISMKVEMRGFIDSDDNSSDEDMGQWGTLKISIVSDDFKLSAISAFAKGFEDGETKLSEAKINGKTVSIEEFSRLWTYVKFPSGGYLGSIF